MPLLPRFTDTAIEDEQRLARILLETGLRAPERRPVNGAGGGEPIRIRGLPAIGRNVSGASPGTDPLQALIAKEERGQTTTLDRMEP